MSHRIQVILDDTIALAGSYLSTSKLLGGAQHVLTGNFGQPMVCKMPLPSRCPLSDAHGWRLLPQLVGPHGGPGFACTTALQGPSWQLSVT